MTQCAINYAKVLFELGISEDVVSNTKSILLENNNLLEALDNPSIQKREKEKVIDDIFQKEIRGFLKVICQNNRVIMLKDIFDAYETIVLDSKNIIKATFSYVSKPEDEEIDKIKQMVCNKYKKAGVNLELKEEPSLIGGFVLTVGDTEYDKSIKGTLEELQKALVWR